MSAAASASGMVASVAPESPAAVPSAGPRVPKVT